MANMVFATTSAPRTRTSTLRTKFDLVDSRDLFGDEEALRAVLRRDGYIFMRGLLYPDWVEDVGRHALSALQDAGWTEPGFDPVYAPPRLPVRAVAMRDAFADPGYRDILLDAGFNAIPYDSPLAWLMRQIMGPEGFCYPLKVPRVVYPASVVPRHPGNLVHKDFASVQDMLTCWVPLQSIPTRLGGLALQPGSQTSTRVRPRPLGRLERGWRTTDYEPGDVLIFHCLTTHAALPNTRGATADFGRVPLADGRPPDTAPDGARALGTGDGIASVPGYRLVAPGSRGPEPLRRSGAAGIGAAAPFPRRRPAVALRRLRRTLSPAHPLRRSVDRRSVGPAAMSQR